MDNAEDVHIPADRLLIIADGFFCTKCNSIVDPDPYNPNYLMCGKDCERVLEGSVMPEGWIHSIVYHAKGYDYAREKEIESETTA